MKKKNERDYFSEFKKSSLWFAGNDFTNEEEVREKFNSKFKEVKKSLAGKDISVKFFDNLSKMWKYLISGKDLSVKTLVVGGLFYFILPIDLIPDFIPIAGYMDDVAVVAGIWNTVKGKLGK
jgi:uncharacterized membrane protein YkvA (DUF1232 family)